MKKVLILGDHLEKTIVRLFDLTRELFETRGYVTLYYKDLRKDNIPSDLQEVVLYPPRIEFIEHWLSEVKKRRVSIFLISEDFHFEYDILPTLILQPYVSANLVRYPDPVVKHINNLKINSAPIVHFPNSVPLEGFRRPNFDEKIDKVLVCGAVSREWYPLRERGSKLLESHAYKHPGYVAREKSSKEIFADFMDTISKYWLCVAGSCPESKQLPYIIAKHFEIAAAGTAMITDKYLEPQLRVLGFEPSVHYIQATENTIGEVVRIWLHPDKREQLKNMIERSQALVRTNFVTEIQIQKLFNK